MKYFLIALTLFSSTSSFAFNSHINQRKAFDRAIKYNHSQQYKFKNNYLRHESNHWPDCKFEGQKNCEKGRESIAI